MVGAEAELAAGPELGGEQRDRPVVHHPPLGVARLGPRVGVEQVEERQRPVGHARQHLERVAVVQADIAERRMRAVRRR